MPQKFDKLNASEDGVDGVDDAVGGDDVDIDDVRIDRRCGDFQNWTLENLCGKYYMNFLLDKASYS